MKKLVLICILNLCYSLFQYAHGQNAMQKDYLEWAVKFSSGIMNKYPDSIVVKKYVQHMLQDKEGSDPEKRTAVWNYEEAVVLINLLKMWSVTKDSVYLKYTKKIIDHFILPDGEVRTYKPLEYNADQLLGGVVLVKLYQLYGEEKYKKALDALWHQIQWQPRTKQGGFWHKHKYPYQMWLDSGYMIDLFYANYANTFKQDVYTDIANQFIWMYENMKDEKTGLLYHGWDESRMQKWADPITGKSPEIWGRSVGWFAMALTDILELFPPNHSALPALKHILKNVCQSIANHQDAKSGVWYQILNKPHVEGNYLEASCSTIFSYVLAKGINRSYLTQDMSTYLDNAYQGLFKNFITIDEMQVPHIHYSCSGAGLGGEPYRSGTFQYYVNEPKRSDELKTIGPLIGLFLEMSQK